MNLQTYSTEETFTGKYWINGEKIYRKCFTDIKASQLNNLLLIDAKDCVNLFYLIESSISDSRYIPYASLYTDDIYINAFLLSFTTTGITLNLMSSRYSELNLKSVIIEYTKNND